MKYIESNSLPNKIDEKLIEQEFNFKKQSIKSFKEKQLKTFIKDIPKYIQKIREEWNYSMFELDYYVTKNFSPDFIEKHVTEVVSTFYYWHPQLTCQYQVVQLALFLIFFHSSHMTYFFLEYIYIQIVPDRINSDSYSQELQFLVEIAKTNNFFKGSEMIIAQKFLEYYSQKILQSLLINFVTFSALFFLFDLVIKFKNFYEFEKTVVQLAKMHIDEIRNKANDFNYLKSYIINNTTVKNLRDYHQRVDRLQTQISEGRGQSDLFTTYYQSMIFSSGKCEEQKREQKIDQLLYLTKQIIESNDISEDSKKFQTSLEQQQIADFTFIQENLEQLVKNRNIELVERFSSQTPQFVDNSLTVYDIYQSASDLERQSSQNKQAIEVQQQQMRISQLQKQLEQITLNYENKLTFLAEKQMDTIQELTKLSSIQYIQCQPEIKNNKIQLAQKRFSSEKIDKIEIQEDDCKLF